MASSWRDKVFRLYKKRGKIEVELQKIQSTIEQSVQKCDGRGKVDTLVHQCEKIATNALEMNGQNLHHLCKTSQNLTVVEELETWVIDTMEKSQVILQCARCYLDQPPPENRATGRNPRVMEGLLNTYLPENQRSSEESS